MLIPDREESGIANRVENRLKRHLQAVIDGKEEGSPLLARMLLDAFTNRSECVCPLDALDQLC